MRYVRFALLISALLWIASCQGRNEESLKEPEDSKLPKEEATVPSEDAPGELDEKPTEIPFVEYSLTGTGCGYPNLAYDNRVIVINSNDDLKKYITCEYGSYPEIDFSKKTLLLASGIVGGGIGRLSGKILEYSQKYVFEVEAILNISAIACTPWCRVIVVNKIDTKKFIELHVTIIDI